MVTIVRSLPLEPAVLCTCTLREWRWMGPRVRDRLVDGTWIYQWQHSCDLVLLVSWCDLTLSLLSCPKYTNRTLLSHVQLYHVQFNLQVCICSVSIPEAVWNQRTSTNSIPGTLQGQSHEGLKMFDPILIMTVTYYFSPFWQLQSALEHDQFLYDKYGPVSGYECIR